MAVKFLPSANREWALRPPDQDGLVHGPDKERSHHSSMYGKIVDASGNTAVADADADIAGPARRKVLSQRPIALLYANSTAETECTPEYFTGLSLLSHGCVRMPSKTPIAFFNCPVQVGLRVTVSRQDPINRYYSGQPQPVFSAAHVSAPIHGSALFRLRLPCKWGVISNSQ